MSTFSINPDLLRPYLALAEARLQTVRERLEAFDAEPTEEAYADLRLAAGDAMSPLRLLAEHPDHD